MSTGDILTNLLPVFRFLGNGLAFNWKEKRTGALLLILLLLIALITALLLHYKTKEKPCASKKNGNSTQDFVKNTEKISLEKRKKIQLRGYIFFLISTPCCILIGSFCDHGATCDILSPFIGTIMMGGFIPLIAGQIFLYESKYIFYPADAMLFFIAGILCLTFIGIPFAFVPWLAGIVAEILLLVYIVTLKIYKVSPESIQLKKETKERAPTQAKALPASYQITPLLNAVLSGDLEKVKAALAEHPEQLNIAYAPNGNTPLHVAALNGKKEIVEFLLTHPDIDTTRKNNDGKTAFDIAAERGGTDFLH